MSLWARRIEGRVHLWVVRYLRYGRYSADGLSGPGSARSSFLRWGTVCCLEHWVHQSCAGGMHDLDRMISLLRQWAEENPCIGEVYVYGSYARGKARPNSDLDVAVRVIRKRPGDSSVYTTYIAEAGEWEADLTQRLGIQVDLDDVTAPSVSEWVRECSIPVYVESVS